MSKFYGLIEMDRNFHLGLLLPLAVATPDNWQIKGQYSGHVTSINQANRGQYSGHVTSINQTESSIPVKSCDQYWPIRDQHSGRVTSIDQTEASIQVRWSVLNIRGQFSGHMISINQTEASI